MRDEAGAAKKSCVAGEMTDLRCRSKRLVPPAIHLLAAGPYSRSVGVSGKRAEPGAKLYPLEPLAAADILRAVKLIAIQTETSAPQVIQSTISKSRKHQLHDAV